MKDFLRSVLETWSGDELVKFNNDMAEFNSYASGEEYIFDFDKKVDVQFLLDNVETVEYFATLMEQISNYGGGSRYYSVNVLSPSNISIEVLCIISDRSTLVNRILDTLFYSWSEDLRREFISKKLLGSI